MLMLSNVYETVGSIVFAYNCFIGNVRCSNVNSGRVGKTSPEETITQVIKRSMLTLISVRGIYLQHCTRVKGWTDK